MALDKLDGDTGDIIVSEVRKKKRPRRATKIMLTTYETRHGTGHGDICWEGKNRLKSVNATLGTFYRFHYPGMVTI
jgi:hypothetical protein